MKKIIAAFGLVLSLAACADDLPPPHPVAHALPPKISLDVQSVTLADRATMQPMNSPYNTNHFSPTINDAIRQWATDRLQASGTSGQAIVLIKNASLTAEPLQKSDDISDSFTRQQTLRYTGRAEVSIEANGRPGFATADAVAMRSVTLPENPNDIERQDAYYKLLTGLMKDLNANLESAINSHMATFVTSASSFGTTPATAMPTPMAMPMATAAPMTTTGITTTPIQPMAPTPSIVPALPPAPPEPAAVAPTSYAQPAIIPLSGARQ